MNATAPDPLPLSATAPDDAGTAVTEAVRAARSLVLAGGDVVVLTGAGISTDSGIPDYRGPRGVWTKDPGAERRANLATYLADPEVRRAAWQQRLRSGVWSAAPNAGHRALVALERRGALHTLITQNIDGLHLAAGHDRARVIEVHGNVREVVCMSCGDRGRMTAVLQRVEAGEDDPPCLVCGGILKSATISFGQSLVEEDLARAFAAAAEADVFLAIGSTLAVYPVAETVPIAARAGAAVIILNDAPTALDALADVVIRASIADVLPTIVGAEQVDGAADARVAE
jgi:NAD-dependent deacetylase